MTESERRGNRGGRGNTINRSCAEHNDVLRFYISGWRFNTSSDKPTQSFTCLFPGFPRSARSARVNYTSSAVPTLTIGLTLIRRRLSAVPTLRRVVNYLVAVNRDKSRESRIDKKIGIRRFFLYYAFLIVHCAL